MRKTIATLCVLFSTSAYAFTDSDVSQTAGLIQASVATQFCGIPFPNVFAYELYHVARRNGWEPREFAKAIEAAAYESGRRQSPKQIQSICNATLIFYEKEGLMR